MMTHEKLHQFYESKIQSNYHSEELFISMVWIVQDTNPMLTDDEALDYVMKYLEYRMVSKFGYLGTKC